MLTVEFLFKVGGGSVVATPAAEPTGASHRDHITTIKKPIGGIMKQPSFNESSVNFQNNQEEFAMNSANEFAKKSFTPYFDYSSSFKQQDLLKPPSRTSSKNRRTAFAEPLETPCDADQIQQNLSEISNCQNPLSSSNQNMQLPTDSGEKNIILLFYLTNVCSYITSDLKDILLFQIWVI